MEAYREFSEVDLKWIRRFKRVMKDAPSDLFLFVGAGVVTIYSERRMDGGQGNGVNQDVPNQIISTDMDCDGGDW